MSQQRGWGTWLREKRHEVAHLRLRDALLAKAVADIHRHTVGTTTRSIALCDISPIHAIDRPGALATVRRRAEHIRPHCERIQAQGDLSAQELRKLLPSVSGFHGITWPHQRVVTFEGNGRLAALHLALGDDSPVRIAVTLHQVDAPAAVQRRVARVRRLNHLR